MRLVGGLLLKFVHAGVPGPRALNSLRMGSRVVDSRSVWSEAASSDQPTTVVVLNWKQPACFLRAWRNSQYRVVADGGADRLYRGVAEGLARREGRPVAAVRDQLLPDLVVGDLDSISSEARDFYRSRGIEVRDLSGDEDTTDLVKCLRAVEQAAGTRGPLPTVLVLGAFGGRFDHTLANVAALHTFSHMDIVLVGDGNIARLLQPGQTVVRVERSCEGPECGVVPMAGDAVVSTSGLRWDMDGLTLSFRGIISTSNLVEKDEVVVTTDQPVLFTLRCALADSEV